MAFGANSVLDLPFPAAAKTGTTNDFRDNWTLGYTPDIAVGVWVGNADYTPMVDTTGVTGAAPIWAQFMQAAIQQLTGGNPTPFSRPPGIVERVVCAVSGTEPSEWCPQQRSEFFAADQLPLPKEDDLWQKVSVDTWTGLKASSACSDFVEDKFAMNVSDPWAQKWVTDTPAGQAWAKQMGFDTPIFFAPQSECTADDPHPTLAFSGLADGSAVTTPSLDIYGVVDASADFDYFDLDYGVGDNPQQWMPLLSHITTPVKQADKLYTWDVSDMPPQGVTLRLYLHSTKGTYAQKLLHLDMKVPTRTPTPTLTATITPTATQTPLPTSTATPKPANTATPQPSPTLPPAPSDTPVPPTLTATQ